jgi:hypothetical protein
MQVYVLATVTMANGTAWVVFEDLRDSEPGVLTISDFLRYYFNDQVLVDH